jgi:hypothetical protein
MNVLDEPTGSIIPEQYQLPDGRMFDNQRDAETALGAFGRVSWVNVTTLGSTVFRFVVGNIEPVPPLRYELRMRDGELVEVSVTR